MNEEETWGSNFHPSAKDDCLWIAVLAKVQITAPRDLTGQHPWNTDTCHVSLIWQKYRYHHSATLQLRTLATQVPAIYVTATSAKKPVMSL